MRTLSPFYITQNPAPPPASRESDGAKTTNTNARSHPKMGLRADLSGKVNTHFLLQKHGCRVELLLF